MSRQSTGVTAANFLDEQWKVDVLAPYAVPQAAQQVLAKLSPPAIFAASHDLILQSVDELVLAQTAMERGVLNADMASVNESADHITHASNLIEQAAHALPA
jgi:hypothetical protein